MKNCKLIVAFLGVLLFSSCQGFNRLLKYADQSYKYEEAKTYFASGNYSRAATLLNDVITVLKGSDKGEESLYMLGLSYYNNVDYITAHETFLQYLSTYPRGQYVELARFYSGKSLYLNAPEARLDQSSTYQAIQELENFIELFPNSVNKDEAQFIIFTLQDRLVEKELYSARLYFNLGNYLGNNYESCVITAQNALKDYPYTEYREELSFLVVRAKYEMAANSVVSRRLERFRDALDECYSFRNEFPESPYTEDNENMLKRAERIVQNAGEDVDEG